MTNDFAIQSASCECPERFCHHVGALALHTGFTTPIFSCVQQEATETTTADKATNLVNQMGQEQKKTEIEFIGLKAGETGNTTDEVHVRSDKKVSRRTAY